MEILIKGEKTVKAEYNEKRLLSDILRDNGLKPFMPCGGNHICGKCRVRVKGRLSPVSEQEKALLGDTENDIRLACFTYAEGDCEIYLNDRQLNVLSDGFLSAYPLNPCDGIGFAVDIGTTTVAVYAYSLSDGKLICSRGVNNPQSAFGADVISRIDAAIKGNGKALSSLIKTAIKDILDEICGDYEIEKANVKAAVITGNTTMLYLLLEKDVKCLSAAPFEINDFLCRIITAADIGLAEYDNLTVYLPRTVDAFVGSDITCSLVALDTLLKTENASIMIDVGTNGEMAIIKKNQLFCCSTAAGPAFEGAGISHGCMAQSGAVNKVWLENGHIKYSTLDNKKAIGICGSGLIDAIAVFLECGVIDQSGYIDTDNEDFSDLIVKTENSVSIKIPNSDIAVSQQDIRAIQLAKAAICGGIYSLMDACKVTEAEIDTLLLAGGFGSFINAENAAKIGLIPKAFADKTKAVGNAAGMGASAILLSNDAQQNSVKIAENAHCLNLSASNYFMEKYIEELMF